MKTVYNHKPFDPNTQVMLSDLVPLNESYICTRDYEELAGIALYLGTRTGYTWEIVLDSQSVPCLVLVKNK